MCLKTIWKSASNWLVDRGNMYYRLFKNIPEGKLIKGWEQKEWKNKK